VLFGEYRYPIASGLEQIVVDSTDLTNIIRNSAKFYYLIKNQACEYVEYEGVCDYGQLEACQASTVVQSRKTSNGESLRNL
jgi:hypothetical protein